MQTDELSDRLLGATLGMMDVLTVELGGRLGLYEALHRTGPLTSTGLAQAAGVDERFAREWLEQQAVTGLLTTDDASRPGPQRVYALPEEHVPVLVDRESLVFGVPLARLITAAAGKVPAVADAFRSGGGVPWSAYGEDMRTGQADGNRPWFLQVLGREWLPSLPDAHARLAAGGRVADVGCGEGWSSIGIAAAYPSALVDGFDVDEASVVAAREHAREHGVADRVRFHLADAAEADGGGYDLVTAFECVHDMPAPVPVLAAMRRLRAPGGQVLVMDEAAAEHFAADGDPVQRLLYGFSVLICLPDGMSHPGSVGTGTVMRPSVLRGYAREAGFDDIEVLPIEHDVFRFYSLVG